MHFWSRLGSEAADSSPGTLLPTLLQTLQRLPSPSLSTSIPVAFSAASPLHDCYSRIAAWLPQADINRLWQHAQPALFGLLGAAVDVDVRCVPLDVNAEVNGDTCMKGSGMKVCYEGVHVQVWICE